MAGLGWGQKETQGGMHEGQTDYTESLVHTPGK